MLIKIEQRAACPKKIASMVTKYNVNKNKIISRHKKISAAFNQRTITHSITILKMQSHALDRYD